MLFTFIPTDVPCIDSLCCLLGESKLLLVSNHTYKDGVSPFINTWNVFLAVEELWTCFVILYLASPVLVLVSSSLQSISVK